MTAICKDNILLDLHSSFHMSYYLNERRTFVSHVCLYFFKDWLRCSQHTYRSGLFEELKTFSDDPKLSLKFINSVTSSLSFLTTRAAKLMGEGWLVGVSLPTKDGVQEEELGVGRVGQGGRESQHMGMRVISIV